MYDKHLDYFLLAADCGSFSKAAEKAFISPNAVIQQINLLESDLGITLFTRTNHGAKLTDAGTSIYHDAKRMIAFSNQAMQRARQIKQAEKQTIRRSLYRMFHPMTQKSSTNVTVPTVR